MANKSKNSSMYSPQELDQLRAIAQIPVTKTYNKQIGMFCKASNRTRIGVTSKLSAIRKELGIPPLKGSKGTSVKDVRAQLVKDYKANPKPVPNPILVAVKKPAPVKAEKSAPVTIQQKEGGFYIDLKPKTAELLDNGMVRVYF